MTNEEAYRIVGERARELANKKEVQKKMVEIANDKGKKNAEKYLYMLAIATLIGA